MLVDNCGQSHGADWPLMLLSIVYCAMEPSDCSRLQIIVDRAAVGQFCGWIFVDCAMVPANHALILVGNFGQSHGAYWPLMLVDNCGQRHGVWWPLLKTAQADTHQAQWLKASGRHTQLIIVQASRIRYCTYVCLEMMFDIVFHGGRMDLIARVKTESLVIKI